MRMFLKLFMAALPIFGMVVIQWGLHVDEAPASLSYFVGTWVGIWAMWVWKGANEL